jgi:hypothetical protein
MQPSINSEEEIVIIPARMKDSAGQAHTEFSSVVNLDKGQTLQRNKMMYGNLAQFHKFLFGFIVIAVCVTFSDNFRFISDLLSKLVFLTVVILLAIWCEDPLC